MDKPELYIPEPSSRAALEALLDSGDPHKIYHALLDAAYFEDWVWVQARCLAALSSPVWLVRGGALEALQILAAVRHEIDPAMVVQAVGPLVNDSDTAVAATAKDVLEDIRNIFEQ